ncbi:MAG: PAS domain-containing protein [Salinisphaera sp.]|jgi:PAS domain-containing protein|nr:PAS domain-containing protein [Salinisphaera sp.]
MHDVTERKQREQELADVRQHLQAVIDASTEVAIIATDRHGQITVFNPGAERLLGYTAEQAVGQITPASFCRRDEIAEYAAPISAEYGTPFADIAALTARPSRGETESRDWTFVRQDGEQRLVRLVISGIHDRAGSVTGYLGIWVSPSTAANSRHWNRHWNRHCKDDAGRTDQDYLEQFPCLN